MNQNDWELLKFYIEEETKEKTLPTLYEIKRNKITIFDFDARVKWIKGLQLYIEERGENVKGNILFFQETPTTNIIVIKRNDEERDFIKRKDLTLEPFSLLLTYLKEKSLLDILGYLSYEELEKLKKLNHPEELNYESFCLLNQKVKKGEWLSFLFIENTEPNDEDFEENIIEVKIQANTLYQNIVLVESYYCEGMYMTSDMYEEFLLNEEHVWEDEKRKSENKKMEIYNKLILFHQTLYKSYYPFLPKTLFPYPKNILLKNNKWVSPCDICKNRIRLITNGGCEECSMSFLK